MSNAIGTSCAAASGTAAAPTATRERGGAGQSEHDDCQDQGTEVHSGNEVRLSLRAEHEAIVTVRVVFEDLPSALHLDQPTGRDHLEIELTGLWAAEPTIGPLGGLHSRDLQISSVDP